MLGSDDLVALVPSTDLDRAAGFYRDVLGLRLVEINPYACVFDAGGTTLRVTKVDGFTPHPFTVLGWKVGDIAGTLAGLAERGVQPHHYPGIPQDDRGIWTTPGGDQVAWFSDPDGNTLSVTQLAAPSHVPDPTP